MATEPDLFETSPEPIVHSVEPSHIRYGNLGEEPILIRREAFEKQEGIHWTNAPVVGAGARDRLFSDEAFNRYQQIFISEHFNTGFNEFTIFAINEEVGKGVFYTPTEKNKPLKKGTIIGFYAGLLQPMSSNKGALPYGYEITNVASHNDSVFYKYFGISLYDAQYYRNAIGYIQHAPTKDVLNRFTIPDEIKQTAAHANVSMEVVVQFGIPFIVAVTNEDIQPNMPLFFDYGDYWKDKPYQLFDQNGRPFYSVNADDRHEENRKVQDPILVGRSMEQLESKLLSKTHEHFVINLRFTIENYRRRNIPGTQALFQKMLKCFDLKTAPAIHNALNAMIEEKSNFEKHPALEPLKKEMVMHFQLHSLYIERNNEINISTQVLINLTTNRHNKWRNRLLEQKIWLEGAEQDLRELKQVLAKKGIEAPEVKPVQGKSALWCIMFAHTPELHQQLLAIEDPRKRMQRRK